MACYAGIYAGKHVVFIIRLLTLAEYLVQLTLNTPTVGFLTFLCAVCVIENCFSKRKLLSDI